MVNEDCIGSSMVFRSSLKSADSNFDNQSKSELLSHVHLLLTSVGLNDSAKILGEEMEKKGLVPHRFNFEGKSCLQSFDEYLRSMKSFSSDLTELIKRLNQLTSEKIPPVIPNLPIRLFASKRQSIDRRIDVLSQVPCIEQIICRRLVVSAAEKIHSTRLLLARELGSQCPFSSRLLLRKDALKNINLHSRILGHLGPIYCVKFDATGRYIFTGADDNLIKMWDARTCLLRYTFRGHTSYIMDMTISPENTMLASGSMDKTVRVWCIQRGKTLMVYKGHTATISTISFLPYFKDDVRYLISAGNDCTVVFYKYKASTKEFNDVPVKFNERTKPGSRIMTMCYSPGGNLVVMGDTHQNIRIFKVSENNIERLFQIAAHTDRVDSLIWAHTSLRFVSGSKDGTAKVWFISENKWNCSTLKIPLPGNSNATISSMSRTSTFPQSGLSNYLMNSADVPLTVNSNAPNNSQSKKNAYKVTMLCWTLFDDLVVSSGSDNLLRTWNWRTGEMLKILRGHTDESFALLAHPVHKEIVLSVGHDAMFMVWDVYAGVCVTKHRNESDNHEIKAIYDMAVSPDGTLVSFVDNHGHLSILGLDSNQKAKSQPHEQFFSTDYRPLTMDDNGYVLDELTGLAPQNMDSPLFVNSEGIPHAEYFQRLVPGNDSIINRIEPICPWVMRQIVPTLDVPQHNRLLDEWNLISLAELKEFDQSLNVSGNVLRDIDEEHRKLVPKPKKARAERSNIGAERRAHIEHMTNLLMNPPPGEPRYVICDEDNTDDDSSYTAGDDSHLSDGANTLHSSVAANVEDEFPDDFDSDYEEGAPERATVYRTRTSVTVTGRVKKRRFANISGDSSNATLSGNDGLNDSIAEVRLRRRKNRNVLRRKQQARLVSNYQDNDDEYLNVPSTSAQNTILGSNKMAQLKGKKKRSANVPILSSSNQNSSNSSNSTSTTEGEENPSDFSVQSGSSSQSKCSTNNSFEKRNAENFTVNVYPQWTRTTERRRFPYIAQLGDVIVYFAQGHRMYINAIVKNNLFKLPRKMLPRSELDVIEVCVVDSIKYVSAPHCLTVLRLNQLRNNHRTELSFDLIYHDYEGVADFVILKEHYDLSLSYNFKSGDAVEFLLNDQVYTGVVQQRKPLEEDYPSSEWCSVVVRWDNNDGDDEPVCPWDLQPKQRNRKSDSTASKEEMEKFGDYTTHLEDWPIPASHNQNASLSASESCLLYIERSRLAIQQIIEHSTSLPFHQAVNLKAYPDYYESVEYPIDLQLIDERLRNKFYRRHLSFLRDVQYLALNARKYNDLKSDIVQNSEIIVEAIFRFLKDFSIPSAGDLLDELAYESFENPAFKAPLKVTAFGGHEVQVETESKTPKYKRSSLDGSKNKSPLSPSVKWVFECRDMANEIINSSKCLKSEEMQSFYSSQLEENMRPSLDDIMNHIEDFEGPQLFVDALSKFFRDFKSFLQDNHSEGRKSKLSKPIIAKFKRMNLDAESAKSPLRSPNASTSISDSHHSEFRKKRAAALSAQTIWRTGLLDSMTALPTTTMNLRNHQRKDNLYGDKGLSADLSRTIDSDEDDFEDDRLNKPGTSGLNANTGSKKANVKHDDNNKREITYWNGRQRLNSPLNETTNINNNTNNVHALDFSASKLTNNAFSPFAIRQFQNYDSTENFANQSMNNNFKHTRNVRLRINNLFEADSSKSSNEPATFYDDLLPSSSQAIKSQQQRENKPVLNNSRRKSTKKAIDYSDKRNGSDQTLKSDNSDDLEEVETNFEKTHRKQKRRVSFSPSRYNVKSDLRKYSSQSSSTSFTSSSSPSFSEKKNHRLKKRQSNGNQIGKRKANVSVTDLQKSKRPRRAAAHIGRGAYEESSANDDETYPNNNTTRNSTTTSRTGRAIRVNAKYAEIYDS